VEESFYHEYAEADERHWWFTGRQIIVRELLARWIPEGKHPKILDVGCGTGGMLKLLAEFGETYGLDPSVEAIEYSRARAGDLVTLYHGGIPEGIPAGVKFDLITAFDVLEHMPDPVAALREIRASLAPGGLFICTVPAFKFLWSEHDDVNHHYRRYTRGMLKDELSNGGFELKYSSYFNSFLFPPIAAVRLIGRLRPRHEVPRSNEAIPPPAINWCLGALFGAERFLLRATPLPAGVSLAAVAAAPNI
jgi:SAM-dependent methyltransferase